MTLLEIVVKAHGNGEVHPAYRVHMVPVLIYLREVLWTQLKDIKGSAALENLRSLHCWRQQKRPESFFFSSQQVSGGLAVYFKGRPLARYIISGPLEGALEDTWSRFINQGCGLFFFFFFPGRSSWVTRQVAVGSQDGNVLTQWQLFFSLFLLHSQSHKPSFGLSLLAETLINTAEKTATTASSTGSQAGWIW